jgi:hypothetical protein
MAGAIRIVVANLSLLLIRIFRSFKYMNNSMRFNLLVTVGLVLGVYWLGHIWVAHAAGATPSADVPKPSELAALQTEINRLKGMVPDQSHAMKDVGYHFANLWFAGQNQNWPLAKFFLDETRSHLRWAVRIIPVRKTKAGDLDLKGILDAVDNTSLAQIQTTINSKDLTGFQRAYRQTLEGCYACHRAAEKPYLRPQIPAHPETSIINFDPAANWPQ